MLTNNIMTRHVISLLAWGESRAMPLLLFNFLELVVPGESSYCVNRMY